MDLQLKGKTALVSGSTAGIGLAIVQALVKEGASVIVNGRTQQRVNGAVQAIGAAHGIAADLGTEAGAAQLSGTENITRFKVKLRAHWHFIVKQNLQRVAPYNVYAIRAVLIESTEKNWASQLRDAARHSVVSSKTSPLFWFTTSELCFCKATPTTPAKRLYTEQPELVFWATSVEDKFLNLAD
jgi:hypothetical protein